MKIQPVIVYILTVLTASSADAQSAKIHGLLKTLNPEQTVDVIVRHRDVPGGADMLRYSRLARLKGSLSLVRSSVFTMKAKDIEQLADDPNVETIAPDQPVTASTFVGGPDYGWMTALDISNSFGTLAYDGKGIGVALLDSGLDSSRVDLLNSSAQSRVVYRD